MDTLSQTLPDVLLIPHFAFPEDKNPPAKVPQRLFVAPVSGDVTRELVHPERDAGFGCIGVPASGVSMPEASVNEHSKSMFRENQVGAAGEVLPVQTEAEAQIVGDATNSKFRRGIPSLDSRHVLASPSTVYDVRHAIQPSVVIRVPISRGPPVLFPGISPSKPGNDRVLELGDEAFVEGGEVSEGLLVHTATSPLISRGSSRSRAWERDFVSFSNRCTSL